MNYVVDILDNIFKEPRNVGISVSQKFQPLELTQTKKKKKHYPNYLNNLNLTFCFSFNAF